MKQDTIKLPYQILPLLAVITIASTNILSAEARTCLMMYQMADNNLDFYLRQDYEELTLSAVVNSPDLRTWVYYDPKNGDAQALPNTVNASGYPVDVFFGSRYITYDQSIGQMRVQVEFPQEMNSDNPDTIQGFLEHAMLDCINSGYDQLMAIFASHGGGFAGYGGDENIGERGRGRHLLQTNQQVAASIRAALDNIVGTSSRLDVLGFDACLMSAVGATDDYQAVAKYLLGSEAVEPGHGWSYSNLTNASSPLALSKEIFEQFLDSKQGKPDHQAPKTLSLVDTDRFLTFINSLESFSADLLQHLQAGDVSLHTFISRARNSAVAFESIADMVGSVMPSALDVGSFLDQLETLCDPGGDLGAWLLSTRVAYQEMLLLTGYGPGTAAATGMHITWPNQGEYTANTALWDQILFSNGNYVTQITPNFNSFVHWFLTSAPPTTLSDADSVLVGKSGYGTVCQMNATPAVLGTDHDPGALILTDSGLEDPATGLFQIETEISTQVTQMMVDYAIDLSTPLKPVLVNKGYTPQDDEYLYLLGGSVAGQYQGSKFAATWDKNFYFLNITGVGTFEALYVTDEGDGSRTIPTIYFPEDKRDQVSQLQFLDYLFFDSDYWVKQGARVSFLKFSVNETIGRINDNLALFVSDVDNGFAELPRQAGGLILPIIYVDAYIQGRKIDTLPGGFNQTVIEWTTQLDYNILTTPAENIFSVIPDTDAVIVSARAWNHGDPNAKPDVRYYDVIRKNRAGSRPLVGEGQPEPRGDEDPEEQQQPQIESTSVGQDNSNLAGSFANSRASCPRLLVPVALGLMSLLL